MSEADSRPYLSIPNWNKYQPKNKNGKTSRYWIRLETNLEDDREFDSLTDFQKLVLIGIWRLRGRSGKNVPNDPAYIGRAIHTQVTNRSHMGHTIATLISHGFLVLTDQQVDFENLPRNETIRNETNLTTSPRKQKRLSEHFEYTEKFESFWKLYPRTNGSKSDAFKAWKKANLENGTFPRVMESLQLYLSCPKWKSGFVKHASTWINGRMWEVEPDMSERTTTNGNGHRETFGQALNRHNKEVADFVMAKIARESFQA